MNDVGLADVVGVHDFIYDGGTIEHIFHVPNVMENIADTLKVGGTILHHSPTNNYVDHGFYQFSPTFFLDYYAANGFTDIAIRVGRDGKGFWSEIDYVPGIMNKHIAALDDAIYQTECIAKKDERSSGDRVPKQGFYRDEWDKAPGSRSKGGSTKLALPRDSGAASTKSAESAGSQSSALLTPPFDDRAASTFRAALGEERVRTEFLDFVIANVLPLSHTSLFWGDRLLTLDKSAGFLEEPAFRAAFEAVRGSHQYDAYASAGTIAWRLHTLVWAAKGALALPKGDFVECGVFKGDMAWVVGEVTGLARTGRQFHLYDSFSGFDPAQTTQADFPDLPGFLAFANGIYSAEGLWEEVQARFRDLSHYHLHKGYLPGTLDRDGFPDHIAYLHIDLNVASVEVLCLQRLFDHVVPGGYVIFDDYGWKAFHQQKEAEDAFFAERGYHILELPTGQGLLVKR